MPRKLLRYSLVLAFLVIASLPVATSAIAHGSMYNPLSRVFGCYLENPESPDTLPCQALVNLSGTQPLYDWNEVNIRDAGENSRSIIPDGHLCSAGRTKFYGLDQARADWPTTTLPSGGTFTFNFSVTASHPVATFYFYVTRDGYNPTVPLKWSDLEATPFATISNPVLEDVGLQYPVYRFTVQLPNKVGRHLIYMIWTRHDSLENFYSCSDVWFGTNPTPTPITPPFCTAPEWQAGTLYQAGSIVSHNGKQWGAKWTNNDEPSTAGLAAAWTLQALCRPGGVAGTPLPTETIVFPTATNTATGPTPTLCSNCGPTNTPQVTATSTPTRTSTPSRTPTRSNTPTGATATPSRTSTRTATPTRTPTRSNTPTGATSTPSRTPTRSNTPTPTGGTGPTCSPVNATITAPYTFDGVGTFCWQTTNLGAYINSWNLANLTINGVNYTNLYIFTSALPAKINGYWYVSYTGNYPWSHFEAK